jgi:hypothetical protein
MRTKRRKTGPAAKVLELVMERSADTCEFESCGMQAVHTHHRRPRRSGGTRRPETNQAANLVRLCLQHHDWIESHRTRGLEMGMLLHDREEPDQTPVRTRHGHVRLDNEGGYEHA